MVGNEANLVFNWPEQCRMCINFNWTHNIFSYLLLFIFICLHWETDVIKFSRVLWPLAIRFRRTSEFIVAVT